ITVAAACSGSFRCAAVVNRAINRADLSQKSEYVWRSDENVVIPSGAASFHSVAASAENPAAARMLVRLCGVSQFVIANLYFERAITIHQDSKWGYPYHLSIWSGSGTGLDPTRIARFADDSLDRPVSRGPGA